MLVENAHREKNGSLDEEDDCEVVRFSYPKIPMPVPSKINAAKRLAETWHRTNFIDIELEVVYAQKEVSDRVAELQVVERKVLEALESLQVSEEKLTAIKAAGAGPRGSRNSPPMAELTMASRAASCTAASCRYGELDRAETALTLGGMDESERSCLLYLLDALRVAPQKSKKLIAVVARDNASESFRKAIDELRNSSDVVRTSAELRESIR